MAKKVTITCDGCKRDIGEEPYLQVVTVPSQSGLVIGSNRTDYDICDKCQEKVRIALQPKEA